MNDITKAGLLFNAASVPCDLFLKLCNGHDPQELMNGPAFWQELGLTEAQSSRLSGLMAKDGWAEREHERLTSMGARFITAKDIDYPARLHDLKRPPVGLYVRGKANLSFPSAAIVGTRKPSDYGRTTATAIARTLAQRGITTVSGGARGIDSSAHRGSLSENGITIAVFGTPIDKVYPTENRDLFSRITERGAVVSEYPFGAPGEAWHFPERNRIIAALASRVVIVESKEDGGAMITADYADELGRELWAVPGRISDENSRGTNRLLAQGAKCLYDVGEFADSFGVRHEQLGLFGEEETVKSAPELSDMEKVIYSLLQKEGNMLIEGLIAESGLDDVDVQMALMNLQAEGLISESSGRYSVAI